MRRAAAGGDPAAERAPFRANTCARWRGWTWCLPGRRSRRRACVTPPTRAIWRRWNAARTRGRCWWSGRITTARCTGRRARRHGRGRWASPCFATAHGAHLNWDVETPTAGALGGGCVGAVGAQDAARAQRRGHGCMRGPGVDAARLRAMLARCRVAARRFRRCLRWTTRA